MESGTIGELRHLTSTTVSALVAQAPTGIAAFASVRDFTASTSGAGTQVGFSVDNAEIGHVLAALARLGVRSLTATPTSLEELFMRHYSGVFDAPIDHSGVEVVAR